MPRDNDDIYFPQVLDRPLSSAIGFSHRQNRGITGGSAGDIEALSFVIFRYELDTLKGFHYLQGSDSFWEEVLRDLNTDGRCTVDAASNS